MKKGITKSNRLYDKLSEQLIQSRSNNQKGLPSLPGVPVSTDRRNNNDMGFVDFVPNRHTRGFDTRILMYTLD